MFLSIFFAIVSSCGEGPTQVDVEGKNDPPDTFITQKSLKKVPLEQDTTGAVLNLNLFDYSIQYTGTDLDGKVDSFQVKVNEGSWSSFTVNTTATGTLEFASESDENTVFVRALDDQGALDPTPAAAVFVLGETGSNARPSTAIESGPSNGATTSSGVQFVAGGNDPDGFIVEFLYSIDGGTAVRMAADAEGKALIEFSERQSNLLAVGNHTVSVQAIDNLGAIDDTPETRSFFVSSGFAPVIQFLAGPADGGGWFSEVDVSFAYSAVLSHYSGTLFGFSWAFDDSSEGAFSEFSTEGLAAISGDRVTAGDHFFVLRAKDLAGVLSQELVRFSAAKASLDQGIIIIDDCGFGENETLEAIFAAAGFPVSRYWDFDGDADNGHPKDDLSIWTPDELGKYSTAVIFTDNSPTAFANGILLGAYVKAGGNLWLTSYNWSVAGSGFLSEIAGIRAMFNNFDTAGITGVNDSWANPWGNTINSSFDGITIDFTGSTGLVEILRPNASAEAIFQATEGSFPTFPRGVYMPHPEPWGKVVSWGHSLRRTASDDPALQAAAAIIFGTLFGE
ncbi:MAG: hypothetical protein ACE5IY_08935 [bacterium]